MDKKATNENDKWKRQKKTTNENDKWKRQKKTTKENDKWTFCKCEGVNCTSPESTNAHYHTAFGIKGAVQFHQQNHALFYN